MDTSPDPIEVRINRRNLREPWEVVVPDRQERFSCERLEDARRFAHSWVAQRHPCEVIIHDAYDRVIERQRTP